jgi:hypothetical protein
MTVAIVSKEIGQKRRVEWRVVSRLKGGSVYIYICHVAVLVQRRSAKVESTVVLEYYTYYTSSYTQCQISEQE